MKYHRHKYRRRRRRRRRNEKWIHTSYDVADALDDDAVDAPLTWLPNYVEHLRMTFVVAEIRLPLGH